MQPDPGGGERLAEAVCDGGDEHAGAVSHSEDVADLVPGHERGGVIGDLIRELRVGRVRQIEPEREADAAARSFGGDNDHAALGGETEQVRDHGD